jgi:hypothetical protein
MSPERVTRVREGLPFHDAAQMPNHRITYRRKAVQISEMMRNSLGLNSHSRI